MTLKITPLRPPRQQDETRTITLFFFLSFFFFPPTHTKRQAVKMSLRHRRISICWINQQSWETLETDAAGRKFLATIDLSNAATCATSMRTSITTHRGELIAINWDTIDPLPVYGFARKITPAVIYAINNHESKHAPGAHPLWRHLEAADDNQGRFSRYSRTRLVCSSTRNRLPLLLANDSLCLSLSDWEYIMKSHAGSIDPWTIYAIFL